MARIRTIKPEFFRHAALFDAEQETGLPLRVAFAGLWTVADREGRFNWRPRELKLDALPHDLVDFARVLTALETHGFIRRYEVEGHVYGVIPSWHDHQVINTREAKSVIPECPAHASTATHVHAHASTATVPHGVNVPEPLRMTVIARDGNRCVRCGATEDLTVDHIFPRSLGGTHAITNLRCLCRSCNSARPVAGQALLDDLASDGFTLADMQRMCMHVHAQGEGKGKEGKGREGEGVPTTTAVAIVSTPAASPRPSKPVAPSAPTWEAYASAYQDRYGVEPVRNAKVNSQLALFVGRLGAEEAPAVARFFVGHQSAFYVRGMHPVEHLLKDAEKLRTEWATGRRVTSTQAAQADRTATNLGAFQRLIDQAKAEDANAQH
jgi:hypothetical protein